MNQNSFRKQNKTVNIFHSSTDASFCQTGHSIQKAHLSTEKFWMTKSVETPWRVIARSARKGGGKENLLMSAGQG